MSEAAPDRDPRELREAPKIDDEAHARRLYVLALTWGVLILVFLWWFARHWRA